MAEWFSKLDWRKRLKDNAVTIMFIVLCIISVSFSGQRMNFILFELFSRISRNAFIVLALIIPIVAGMGINFAITIGAMAAQIALLWVLNWRVPGIGGFFLSAALTVPIAGLFGFLVGSLLNKMKGQEMIGSMILGFFANGIYQLLFLYVFGNIIPMSNPDLVIVGSTGIGNTMDLSKSYGMKYALDNLWKLSFHQAVYVFAGLYVLYVLYQFLRRRKKPGSLIINGALALLLCAAASLKDVQTLFMMVKIPMATYLVIALLCLFNIQVMRTRLGQRFRAVGQSRVVSNAAGINVNRTRLVAITMSTILAGWGQLIFVQNMGSLQTYGAHEQVGLFAGAAILVGGASIMRATNAQAILGCILFHMLFIVAPQAGKNIFGDAAIGEYFRVFISYGVIAMALVMHAWRSIAAQKAPKPAADAAASGK